MKALVTGGGGFVGGAIVRALLERGDEVTTFSRGDYPELAALGARHVRGDVADHLDVAEVVAGQDAVFHVASLVKPFGKPADFDRINIVGTQNIIDACIEQSVGLLVNTSTPSVIHDGVNDEGIDESKPYPAHHDCDYFRSKAEAERRVSAANGAALADGGTLYTTSIRPHGVYGPGDTSLFPLLIARAKAGRLRVVGSGDTKVDWTFIDNAVHGHLLALAALKGGGPAAGKVYFIADDNPVNPWEFFNGILAELDLPRISGSVSLGTAKTLGGVAETVWRWFGLAGEPPGTRAMASILGTSHWFDLSAAKNDLGYTPIVSPEEALARTVPYLRAELEAGRL